MMYNGSNPTPKGNDLIPSSMIHLLTARKTFEQAPLLLYIGALAPDGVGQREVKDRSHYRSVPDRAAALSALAAATAPGDHYGEGVLLHLFTDWLWDEECFVPFRETNKDADPDWFIHYRQEISNASAHLFHTTDWAIPLNRSMLTVSVEQYGHAEAVTPQAANAYINRNFNRHMELPAQPSAVYPPDFVEDFTSRAAEQYRQWRAEHPYHK